jgi:hypothetical protein
VIKTADWLIDMGPEGGAGGGMVVACGTPETICANPASHTGRYLAPILRRGGANLDDGADKADRADAASMRGNNAGARRLRT